MDKSFSLKSSMEQVIMRIFAILVLYFIKISASEKITDAKQIKFKVREKCVPSLIRIPLSFSRNSREPSIDSRIAFGSRATEGQFPFHARLVIKENETYGYHCGGILIKSNIVLTASHCLFPMDFIGVDLFFGSVDRRRTVTRAEAEECTIHPKFDLQSITHDIAIIKMDRSVSYPPIQLPKRSSIFRDFVGEKFTVMGFGLDETGNLSRYLMFSEDNGIPTDNCNRNNADPSLICTRGGGNSGTQKGDSGGALICDETVVGIVSYGIRRSPDKVSGYTRVDHYLDWISHETGMSIVEDLARESEFVHSSSVWWSSSWFSSF